MEHDENYVPYLRSYYRLPSPSRATKVDYADMFDETPIVSLFRIVIMQLLYV